MWLARPAPKPRYVLPGSHCLDPPYAPPNPPPSWVPQGAIGFFDFTQGLYWFNGQAMTVSDLGQIFASNAGYPSTWDPSKITSAGMAKASQPAIVGALAALFFNPGCTSVWQINSSPGAYCFFILDSSAPNTNYTWEYCFIGYDDAMVASEPNARTELAIGTPSLPDGLYRQAPVGTQISKSGQRNKVVYTFSPRQFAISVNGQQTFDAGAEYQRGDLTHLSILYMAGEYTWMEKFTIYPTQPNSVLPGLST